MSLFTFFEYLSLFMRKIFIINALFSKTTKTKKNKKTKKTRTNKQQTNKQKKENIIKAIIRSLTICLCVNAAN